MQDLELILWGFGAGCEAPSRWSPRSPFRSRLKPVIRALGVEDDGTVEREELEARRHTAEAALARLEELAGEA